MKLPEQEEQPQEDSKEDLIEELPEPEVAQPTERQGGEVSKEYVLSQIDLYLHRLFQVGEEFPWKGVKFMVVGISNGVVGLAVKHIPTPPKARANHGRRPSRPAHKRKKRVASNEQRERNREIEAKRQEAREARKDLNEAESNQD